MKENELEKINKRLKNRAIDNLAYVMPLMIVCDGDIRTNSELDKKYGNRIYEITNDLINLVSDMKKDKETSEDYAYPELKEFIQKAIYDSEGDGFYYWSLNDRKRIRTALS